MAYLRSKFNDIEVIVPTYAMSAGTMISLAANRIVMGRQSQLGPIDPQFLMGQRAQSARAVVDQFEEAKKEILEDAAAAGVWFPILQTFGPALLQEAVLTFYHLATIAIEKGPASKIIHSDLDTMYVKNWAPTPQIQLQPVQLPSQPTMYCRRDWRNVV